ncbi:hypothetical protein N2152v2_001192 [Parachlorella kessleri]
MACSFCPGPQQQFKGDHELLVDRLVVASQKKQVDDSLLQERVLVPFFEPSDLSKTTFEPLERRSRRSPPPAQQHHGLKRNAGERSGGSLSSSPKKENHLAKQRRSGAKAVPAAIGRRAAYHSDSELSSTTNLMRTFSTVSDGQTKPANSPARGQRKHARQHAESVPTAAAAVLPRRSPSPPHKREHLPSSPMGQYGKFAGPSFCNSPTPDSLPIPTTTLLMQQAADSIRSRLTL